MNTRIDQTIVRKQEVRAKCWAIKKLLSLQQIIKAFKSGARNMAEMAEHLNVTEQFLIDSFKRYNAIYGKYKEKDGYLIYFDPPGILKSYKDMMLKSII